MFGHSHTRQLLYGVNGYQCALSGCRDLGISVVGYFSCRVSRFKDFCGVEIQGVGIFVLQGLGLCRDFGPGEVQGVGIFVVQGFRFLGFGCRNLCIRDSCFRDLDMKPVEFSQGTALTYFLQSKIICSGAGKNS